MTVASTNALTAALGNAAATVFNFEFDCKGSAEVSVYVDGELQVNGYTVAVNANGVGGTVTFATPPADGAKILLVSDPAFTQLVSFENAGPFLPTTHDEALDRAAIRDIMLKAMLDRSILAPWGESVAPLESAASRANKFLQFDANGNPTASANVAKGDPGGNVMAIGLFSIADTLDIDLGTDTVRTSGHSALGFGAADYIADVAVDAAYAAANPRTSFVSANGRGFRLSSEGPHNPARFGIVEGDSAANGANNSAAMTALLAFAVASENFHVRFPAGTYWFNAPIDVNQGNLIIEGAGGGGHSKTSSVKSVLKFPAGVTGIRVQGTQTSGSNTKDAVAHDDGRGTTVRDLMIVGAFVATEAEAHGVQVRTMASIENVSIESFEGDGIHIAGSLAAADGADPPYGNTNNCFISGVSILSCRDGIRFLGDDANAATVVRPICFANRRWGINDGSGFSNTFIGGAMTANGLTAANDGVTIGAAEVSSGGNIYGAIAGQEVWCSTNAPSGTTADNQGWYYLFAGAPAVGRPAWFNGILVRAGGAVRHDSVAGTSGFFGIYAEADQGKAQIVSPGFVSGGLLASWCLNIAAVAGMAAPRIRGGLDVTNTGAAVVVEPMLSALSGSVTSSLGSHSGNASNVIHDMNHPTLGRYQLSFSTGLGNILFGSAAGTNYYQVTTTGTTTFFGTSAAVPGAFTAQLLMVQDNGKNIANARRVTIDTVAPATGAHGQGEWCFFRGATAGLIGWKCTVAGTPGTWEAVYSGYGTGPIGYTAGAGGTVTQITSKSTGVTLNKASGQITMNAAALAAAAKVAFVVTNSQVAATDTPTVAVASGGTANAYRAEVTAVAAGSFTITVENITAGSLSEAPVINFNIIKGASA